VRSDNVKIGILTIFVDNYGAVMQTYALNKTLNSMGHTAETVNYVSTYYGSSYKPLRFNSKNPVSIMLGICLYPFRKYKSQAFKKFRATYIKMSKMNYTKDELVNLDDLYDILIVGSDQVWNKNVTHGDTAYLFDFLSDNNKKYSYAASFGVKELPLEIKDEYRKSLSEFKRISVRERSAIKILENLNVHGAVKSLDPTLLINKEEWLSLASEKNKYGDYVLVYLMQTSSELIEIAKNYAKKHNYKVIFINDNFKRFKGVKTVSYITPKEWLSLICYAKCVFTNSFHGLAFSINLNREFYVMLHTGKSNNNSRMEDMLSDIGLSNRLVSPEIPLVEKQINWEKVNQMLDTLRNDSMTFLEEITNEQVNL